MSKTAWIVLSIVLLPLLIFGGLFLWRKTAAKPGATAGAAVNAAKPATGNAPHAQTSTASGNGTAQDIATVLAASGPIFKTGLDFLSQWTSSSDDEED